jgi:hypothetical protein
MAWMIEVIEVRKIVDLLLHVIAGKTSVLIACRLARF